MDNQPEEIDALRRLRAQEEAERLARAKADAATRGKEPFDLDRLEQLYDTTSDLGHWSREERFRDWVWKYYVQASDLLTLAEFAERPRHLDP
jgi:hypothetical protein